MDKPPLIFTATRWSTNGHMIADCHRIGYLRDEDVVIDPTFGEGVWWKQWRPTNLVTHSMLVDGVDFRDLPYDDDTFDAGVLDVPYVSPGGRETTGIPEMHGRYGMDAAPRTPVATQQQLNDGLTELARVVRPRDGRLGQQGYILVKTQNYVTSGKLFESVYFTRLHAERLGLRLKDQWEFLTEGGRPQPGERTRKDGKPVTQQHGRRNNTTLLIFEKGRKPWKSPFPALPLGAVVVVD